MSIKTWKEAAYPVEARLVRGKLEAVGHSILKWSHLDAPTLEQHGLEKEGTTLVDDKGQTFEVNDRTCALCHLYVEPSVACSRCPLYRALGYSCDSYRNNGPYVIWMCTGCTEPMMKSLKEARELVLKEMEK